MFSDATCRQTSAVENVQTTAICIPLLAVYLQHVAETPQKSFDYRKTASAWPLHLPHMTPEVTPTA